MLDHTKLYADIEMPKMNGIRLAAKKKETHPDMHIIFLTGYAQYALEALRVHANGYCLSRSNKNSSRRRSIMRSL